MTDDPHAPIPFDPRRGRAARKRVVASLQEAVDEFRATMQTEQRARLDWMRRHAILLGLDVPDDATADAAADAAATRELERELMAVAGARLREPVDGADPDALEQARTELRELERIERANFERLSGKHGAVLGIEAPSGIDPG